MEHFEKILIDTNLVEYLERIPGERAYHHHEHHANKRGDGHHLNVGRAKEDESQQGQRRCDAREPTSPA